MGEENDNSLLSKYYFQEDSDSDNVKVPSIITEYVDDYPSVVDRFFHRYYYYAKTENPREVYLVLCHSNRVCLIGLAPVHPAFDKGIKSLSFVIGNKDGTINKLKGKSKKGGLPLQNDSTLAILKTNDDVEYKVPSCIKSKLIEVNTKLIEHPELLSKEGYGYIAIVLPKLEEYDEIKRGLHTQEQYEKRNLQ